MVEKNYEKIIILEDDAKFSLGFKSTLSHFIDEMKLKKVDWELLYKNRLQHSYLKFKNY
jgi:GR25 family glycosyltransferase involved in LPS biosynthesis